MTWQTGMVARVEIKRLADRILANLSVSASADDILRLCVGMALAQDLVDGELLSLMTEVGARLGLSLAV